MRATREGNEAYSHGAGVVGARRERVSSSRGLQQLVEGAMARRVTDAVSGAPAAGVVGERHQAPAPVGGGAAPRRMPPKMRTG